VVSPDDQTVVSGADDRTIVLWNLKTGNSLYTWSQPDIILSVAISPDGKLLTGAGLSKIISRWNFNDKSLLDSFFKAGSTHSHDGIIYAIAISSDGKTLASGSADHTIRVWRFEIGCKLEKLKRTLLGHSDTVLSAALTKDGKTLVSGSSDQTVRIWDLTSWKAPLILTGHSAPINSVAIHPDEQIGASGSTDSTIRFWDLRTGKHLHTLEGHQGAVSHIVFRSDGRTLVSSSKDGTIKFWQIFSNDNETLEPKHLCTLPGKGPIALSSNGNVLICSGDRGVLQVWCKAPI
jgi:WD40 repeat protein